MEVLSADWVYSGGDIPVHFLGARWCRQGPRVDVSLIRLEKVHELSIWYVLYSDLCDAFFWIELIEIQAIEELIDDLYLLIRY